MAARVDFAATPGGGPLQLVVADFDGDRLPDAVFSNTNTNNLSVFRNTSIPGLISFASRNDIAVGISIYDLAAADMDGDGKKDLIVSTNSNFISLYRNISTAGNILFAAKIDFAVGGTPGSIAVADGDGDGKPDLFTGNLNNVTIFKNNSTPGTFVFNAPVAVSASSDPTNIAIADFNADGKPDLVTSNRFANNISVFRNSIGVNDVFTCLGTTSLASGLTGTGYQWYMSTDSMNYNPVVNNSNFSGATTATLQLTNINSSWSGYKFKCISSAGTSNTFNFSFGITWIGGSGTSWNTPANWSCGIVPDLNTDVIINSGTIVISSNSTCKTLKLAPGVSFTINPGVVLTITH